MRRILHIAGVLWPIWTFLWIPSEGNAQAPFDPVYRAAAASITDHLEVFTDRTLYVAGEEIRFRADYFRKGLPGDRPWSSVIYAELLAPDGSPVVVSKWAVHQGFANGALVIPREVLTGHYLLRCYTRWMRNRDPGNYNYTLLKIINPFRREVAGSERSGGQDSGAYQLGPPVYAQEMMQCSPEKSRYRPGEWIRLTLQAPGGIQYGGFKGCLTVVPEGSVDTLVAQRSVINDPASSESFQIQYLPDLGDALTLSGMLVKGDGTPAGEAALSFSLLGPEPDLITATTDPRGRFAVQIPARESSQDFLVTTYPGADDSLEVRIDQDLDGRKIPIATGAFRLTEGQQEVATRMAIRWQIMDVYQDTGTTQQAKDVSLNRTLPFYGSDVERTDLKDYVNLPTLEEIFINLIPDVNVVRRRGTPMFSIQGDNRSLGFYRPLVLVDYIPIFDLGTLLALDPREFERIEVIKEVYVKGAMAFGGVISLFTKNGDMAGLDLPEGSYFFDMTPLGTSPEEEMPGSDITRTNQSGELPANDSTDRMPHLRNTVFWEADLRLDPGSRKEILFRAPDGPGDYTILFRGAISPGTILSGNSRIRVQRPGPSGKLP